MGRKSKSRKSLTAVAGTPRDSTALGCWPTTLPVRPLQPMASVDEEVGTPTPECGSRDPLSKNWLKGLGLFVVVYCIYQPAWHGGILWDDDQHLTNPGLRSFHGLYRIWFELGATQQYYPLLHSVFWLEHRLWGGDTLAYHLVNLALHGAAALLVVVLLQRLRVPGAWLAGVLFAIHPVHVETVAWITELKNTLSAVFYLAAAVVYLRFDQTRSRGPYWMALGLFLLGLLSKTVVATLPAALLLIFWWQRGELHWRRDVRPLIPFFVIGAAAGILTAWVERKLIGAEGSDFDLSAIERMLIAGRAVWFYFGKLFWPRDLTFIYPRWDVDAAIWWQYLYPLTLLLGLVVLWQFRAQRRWPLAAALFFVGTLFPVLGFLNVYPFVFSFVADHFQYLASVSIIAVVAAGAAAIVQRFDGTGRVPAQIGIWSALILLGILSWRQSHIYAKAEVLYEHTIDRNPACFMAHNNLGLLLAERGQIDQAIAHYEQALAVKPNYWVAHNNLGDALVRRGDIEGAQQHFRNALDMNPNNSAAHNNLGLTLAKQQKIHDAIEHYQKALTIDPQNASAHFNLGNAYNSCHWIDDAIICFRAAVHCKPDYAEAHHNLGTALVSRGRIDEAIQHFREAAKNPTDELATEFNLANALGEIHNFPEAIRHYQRVLELKPDFVEAHNLLGLALVRSDDCRSAIDQYILALAMKPDYAEARFNLAAALAQSERLDEACEQYRELLRIAPDNAAAHFNFANILAARQDYGDAITHFRRAIEIKPDHFGAHNNLAAVFYERNRFDEAAEHYRKAIEIQPASIEAHYSLGSTLAQTGRTEAAMDQYLIALRLAMARNDGALITKIESQIKSLR